MEKVREMSQKVGFKISAPEQTTRVNFPPLGRSVQKQRDHLSELYTAWAVNTKSHRSFAELQWNYCEPHILLEQLENRLNGLGYK